VKQYPIPDYDNRFDFYRCLKCNRLITHLEMEDGLPIGKVCRCGALKYSPVDLKWYQHLLPRVINFAFYRALGRA